MYFTLSSLISICQDELKQVALCFARDEWIRYNSSHAVHRPLLGLVNEVLGAGTSAPPCAVQPFAGLATYFAPLCYVYKDLPALYSVCRKMYAQIWSRLNVFSSDEGTLMHVCKTFEDLLIAAHPRLYMHLTNIGLQPLKVTDRHMP